MRAALAGRQNPTHLTPSLIPNQPLRIVALWLWSWPPGFYRRDRLGRTLAAEDKPSLRIGDARKIEAIDVSILGGMRQKPAFGVPSLQELRACFSQTGRFRLWDLSAHQSDSAES
jgi:hypothetical protein